MFLFLGFPPSIEPRLCNIIYKVCFLFYGFDKGDLMRVGTSTRQTKSIVSIYGQATDPVGPFCDIPKLVKGLGYE
jgi:hypothetical protein